MCTVTRLDWKPPGQLDPAFSPLPVCDHACDDSQSRHTSVKARSRSPSPAHTGDRLIFCFWRSTRTHFSTSCTWALGEAIDIDSEAYCLRRSGFFWCMRASLGLACANANTLCSQVFGKGNSRSRAGRPRTLATSPDSRSLSPHRVSLSILCCLSVSFYV